VRHLKIRPHPARPHQPPSKLVPSSATGSRRTIEASHPHLANGAAAPVGLGLWTRRFSRPCTKNAAFENSTTSREATPTAVETRSEFRYRIEAGHPHLAHGAAAPVGLGLWTRRSSRPCTKNAAFENSTTSREATPTAVETRSGFRYEISASSCPSLTDRP
jgi:hypothetical protein